MTSDQRGPAARPHLPALDGVRALAVVAVLLYHGQVARVSGGFLGVDVFFVLSGFLITGLLADEWAAHGSIRLGRFWLRRARRLLPAMLLVVVAVAGYAAWAVPDDQVRSIRGDLLASISYVANWHFVAVDRSYFAQFEAPSPLLHVWSLAIEEQFYLGFPLLLGVLLLATRSRRLPAAAILLLGAAASAVLMAVLTVPGEDPSRVYYGTDTRAQGLLLGAALALLLPLAGTRVRALVQGVGLLSLGALVVTFGTVHSDTPGLFRGGFLLVAVASAALVGAAAGPEGPVVWLLSRRPVVAVGLVSYGVYLWHWPVYVLLDPARTGLDGAALLGFRVFVTGVVATLSFHFVEQPVRQGALGRLGLRARLATVASAVAAALVAVLALGAGLPTTAATAAGTTGGTAAVVGTGARSAFLVGDSVPFGLREAFQPDWAPDLAVNGSTALGCGLIPERLVVDGDRRDLPQGCTEWSQRWPSELAAAAPTFPMLFLGIGELFDHLVDGRVLTFGSTEYAAHLREVLDAQVQQAGGVPGHPVVLVDVPCHGVPVDPDESDGEIINDDSRNQWLNRLLDDFAAGSEGRAVVLDLHGFLCQDGYTNTRDGVRLHKDGLHFTEAGARIVWRWIADRLAELPSDSAVPGATPGTVQALVVGDSVAYGLHSRYVSGQVPGLAVAGSTELGCGLFPDLLVAEDKRIPAEPQCAPWPTRWQGEVDRLRPQVSLLMIGSWEQYDRIVAGRRLRVGTPAYATYLQQRVEGYLDVLERSSGSVALTTVPCHRTPDFDLGPEPGVVNDDARVDEVNDVIREVAADRPEVSVVDLHGFLCGAGYQERMDGVQLHTDGLHFTAEGAAVVWRWLGPQLAQLAPRAS